MRLQTYLVSLLILLTAVAARGEAPRIAADSRVTSVTVFPDRAQITRSASVRLQPGTNLIVFDKLPLLLSDDSLRVEGKGSGVRITGLTVRNVFLERLQEKRVRELEDEIQQLNRKVEAIEARRKALAAQRSFLDSIRVGWGERISQELALGKPTAAELNEAVKFVGEGVGRVEEQNYAAEAEKRPLLEAVAALRKQLEQERGNRKQEVKTVELAVEAASAQSCELDLTYLVGQASWEPAYDLRLASDGKSAELTYRGMVWQRTGENWAGVKLALSSASPESGGAPPELAPWRIGFYQPPAPYAKMEGYRAMAAAPMAVPLGGRPAAKGADGEDDRLEPVIPQSALVSEGQTSVQFDVVQPVEIPADGSRHGSVIARVSLPVTAAYITVPKLSPRVYLKSEVQNASSYPLLPGTVSIFDDATFTGKSQLKMVAAGEKFDLYFGADDRLKVKREMEKVRKQGGILTSEKVTYRVRIELESFKKRPVAVTLLDQLPVAGNEEIKVNLGEAEPKPDQLRADGTILWQVPLAPGEKKRIPFEITVEYPKGRELAGIE